MNEKRTVVMALAVLGTAALWTSTAAAKPPPGTRAEIVINDEGETAGVVQVRNDGFAVYPESAAGIRGMLVRVAHELSVTGS
jgi:hypothetical protein